MTAAIPPSQALRRRSWAKRDSRSPGARGTVRAALRCSTTARALLTAASTAKRTAGKLRTVPLLSGPAAGIGYSSAVDPECSLLPIFRRSQEKADQAHRWAPGASMAENR